MGSLYRNGQREMAYSEVWLPRYSGHVDVALHHFRAPLRAVMLMRSVETKAVAREVAFDRRIGTRRPAGEV